ncbi:MAG TPA: NUDIX domain-containing protein [Longimicrobiales bacterium]
MSRPEKQSVAVVIRNPQEPAKVLTVLRPEDDEDLPNVWGLPAATLRPGEDWNAAIERVGLEKLGVQLKIGSELERGTLERRDYRLEMRLYDAQITKGTPFVPQPDDAFTQYSKWKWGTAQDLQPAAQRGSLCCRLYLRNANVIQS